MDATLDEIKARVKYCLLCFFAVDGSWSMGAYLQGSVFPWGGYWINDKGIFSRYSSVVLNRGLSNGVAK